MKYEILESGSAGNCAIIEGKIAIDMGISFRRIDPYAQDLQTVLLTHIHG